MDRTMLFQRAHMHTPIGELCIVTDDAGHLRACDWRDYEARTLKLLGRYYPRGVELRDARGPAHVMSAFEAYFAGQTRALDALEVNLAGTEFQRSVWNALRAIPAGQTTSYGELAQRLGRPRAIRAVGLANGANPIGVVLPCHRVIGASGSLTGYAGGLERKRWLLHHEGVRLRGAATSATLGLFAQGSAVS